MSVAKLKLDPDFELLFDPLKQSEFDELEKNLVRDGGAIAAIVVWDGFIIDGHNRYKICQKHGLPFNTHEMKFNSKDVAIEWMIRHQLGRRNLNDDRWGFYQGKLYNSRKDKQGGDRKSSDQHDHLISGKKVCEQIAEETGTGSATVRRNGKRAEVADALQEAGLIDEAEKVKSSKQTTQAAVNEAHLALKKVKPGGGSPASKEQLKEVAKAVTETKPKPKSTVSPGGGLVAPLPDRLPEPLPQDDDTRIERFKNGKCPTCGLASDSTIAMPDTRKKTPAEDKDRRKLVNKEIEALLMRAMHKAGDLEREYGTIKSKDAERCKQDFVALYSSIKCSLGLCLGVKSC